MLLYSVVLVSTLGGLLLLGGGGSVEASTVKVGNISKVEDAAYFHIYYGNTFKVIKNGFDGKSYLLIQNNTKMAAKTKYCTSRIKSFVIPLSNYSLDANYFPVSFFEVRLCDSLMSPIPDHYWDIDVVVLIYRLLGLLPNMKGATTEIVASPCLLKLYNEGQIQMLNRSEPQEFSHYTAHFVQDNTNQQTQSCNFVTFVPVGEQDPLQRAEWIKYLGVFANMEVRANEIYDAITNNYKCLVNSAANKTKKFKPIVAWMEFIDDAWSFTEEPYKLKYIEDAGGENIDASINKVTYNISINDDLEQLHAILCTVDVVIDGTFTPDPVSYNATSFLQNLNVEDQSCFGFLSYQSLWRHDKRVTNNVALDWYDGAVSQPQLVLADLIEVLFPSGNYTTTYFRNLVKEEPTTNIGPQNCDRDSFTAMEPTIVACT